MRMLVVSENYQNRIVSNKLTKCEEGMLINDMRQEKRSFVVNLATTLSNVKYICNISQRVLNDYRGPEILPPPHNPLSRKQFDIFGGLCHSFFIYFRG